MTDLAFTDTHVHFWDLDNPSVVYGWLLPERDVDPAVDLGDYRAIEARRYWPDDFLAETRFQGVTKVVHVQAATNLSDPVEETRWLQAAFDRVGMPHGIVAYVDLADPGAKEVIARHAEMPNLRGIRDLRFDDYFDDERWQEGYATLERYGLVACGELFVEMMSRAAEHVRSFPGITFCVDHAGFPPAHDRREFEAWRTGMRRLSRVQNTVVKISSPGIANHLWSVDSIRPWILECIEAWGTERSFFGTNWPVERLFSSYGDILDAYREIVSDLKATEQMALVSGNANRIFRLSD